MIRSIARLKELASHNIEVDRGVTITSVGNDETINDLKSGRIVSRKIIYQGAKYYVDLCIDKKKLLSGETKKAEQTLCHLVGKDVWYNLYPNDSY